MLYCNRTHAGEELAAALRRHSFHNPLVLAITRAGVEVAVPIARALDAELGFLASTSLRAPWNPEVAIGAVTADGLAYVDEAAMSSGVQQAYLDAEKAKQVSLARQREKRLGGRRPTLQGRTVILVEAGTATGATAIAAIRSCKFAHAGRVVLALPVGIPEAIERVRREADEVVCLREDENLFAVGEAYGDFPPIEDGEVDQLLRTYRRPGDMPASSGVRSSAYPSPVLDDPFTQWGVPSHRSIDWFSHMAAPESDAPRLPRS